MRVIVRREHPHPGATLDAFEIRDGYRYQAFTTNTPGGQLAFLDARHRAHARVEDLGRQQYPTQIGSGLFRLWRWQRCLPFAVRYAMALSGSSTA